MIVYVCIYEWDFILINLYIILFSFMIIYVYVILVINIWFGKFIIRCIIIVFVMGKL